jgi:hypothetical protein
MGEEEKSRRTRTRRREREVRIGEEVGKKKWRWKGNTRRSETGRICGEGEDEKMKRRTRGKKEHQEENN